MSRFDVIATPIAGLHLLQRKPIGDQRGYLERMYCRDDMADILDGRGILQVNHTYSVRAGTLRGMHFQFPPHAECKIVSCLRGEIFDVAIDLRRDSPTFLCWHGEILSAENHRTLLIPEGFAHGFQSLTDHTEVLYLSTAPYRQEAEGALHAEDPRIDIRWPAAIAVMSDKDRAHPFIAADYEGVRV